MEGARELAGDFLIRALIPFMKAPPSWPNYLLKAPSPNTITLEVRIPIYEFWGDINIHSTAHPFKIHLIIISFISRYIIGRSFNKETHLTPLFSWQSFIHTSPFPSNHQEYIRPLPFPSHLPSPASLKAAGKANTHILSTPIRKAHWPDITSGITETLLSPWRFGAAGHYLAKQAKAN